MRQWRKLCSYNELRYSPAPRSGALFKWWVVLRAAWLPARSWHRTLQQGGCLISFSLPLVSISWAASVYRYTFPPYKKVWALSRFYKTKFMIFSQMYPSSLPQVWLFASQMIFHESRLQYHGGRIATALNSESDGSQVYSYDLWTSTHVAGAP